MAGCKRIILFSAFQLPTNKSVGIALEIALCISFDSEVQERDLVYNKPCQSRPSNCSTPLDFPGSLALLAPILNKVDRLAIVNRPFACFHATSISPSLVEAYIGVPWGWTPASKPPVQFLSEFRNNNKCKEALTGYPSACIRRPNPLPHMQVRVLIVDVYSIHDCVGISDYSRDTRAVDGSYDFTTFSPGPLRETTECLDKARFGVYLRFVI